MRRRCILDILVEDQPEALTRIAGLIARRGFSVDTISIGKTTNPEISKIVLAMTRDENSIEQTKKQLSKLICTVKVSEIEQEQLIAKELSFIKVKIGNRKDRDQLLRYREVYKADIVDITPESVTFQVVGHTNKIDSFIKLLKEFRVKEISRTGLTAIKRDNTGFYPQNKKVRYGGF